ncbi:hypothetical protein L198_04413 [Cryptococcus wingfieldii CBS 7118]|uniref:Uncharacterized protein n=1 Tax=Cryptococcus wingfieldii CBS 7118 TaxID=1295528 RepID=A0A1E3J576_9TREE|nr:hypothetical protein L198_04413 [Cryptococcus wingfieldii CBS 7118]ODN95795.1 hypothetical protein L198_04413 [Cryptococcus wingfieldii CBS 7118]
MLQIMSKPSYVPRSRPASSSPAVPQTRSPAYVPRSASSSRAESAVTPKLPSQPLERKSSRLRYEMRPVRLSEEAQESAKSILKLLSSLPAPLPEELPPTFLPSPSASPVSSAGSPPRTFSEYVRAKRKRALESSDSEPELAGQVARSGAGVGLGLSVSPGQAKMRKTEDEGRNVTPLGSPSLLFAKKERVKSGLRNEVDVHEKRGGGEDARRDLWKREKWIEMSAWYRDRALLLKRHGDAYFRSPTAHKEYTSTLPADHLKGLLCLTDSALLYNYSHFCEEKAKGRPSPNTYDSSAGLRKFVCSKWEAEMRKEYKGEEGVHEKERAKAMAGLMYLLEAVIQYQTGRDALAMLQHRGKELQTTSTSPRDKTSPSASNTTASPNPPPPQPASVQGPSPASSHSPAHSPSSSTSSLPPDLLPLIFSSFRQNAESSQSLHLSRHHLTLRILRSSFPTTYQNAINSELADHALPAPGDALGSARYVDVDETDRFCWPIEIGMVSPVAHVVAFGRRMVQEMAEREGRDWSILLE